MDTANRRKFLVGALGAAAVSVTTGTANAQRKVARASGVRVKLGLNAYSFNRPLTQGSITLSGVVDYCAQHGIDALDATGYYFPG